MKLSLAKSKVMKMGCFEKRLNYEYHLAEDKFQELICEGDLRLDIVPIVS